MVAPRRVSARDSRRVSHPTSLEGNTEASHLQAMIAGAQIGHLSVVNGVTTAWTHECSIPALDEWPKAISPHAVWATDDELDLLHMVAG